MACSAPHGNVYGSIYGSIYMCTCGSVYESVYGSVYRCGDAYYSIKHQSIINHR